MKAPSVAPTTASQVFADTVGAAGAAAVCGRSLLTVEAPLMVGWSAVMGVSSESWQTKRQPPLRRIVAAFVAS